MPSRSKHKDASATITAPGTAARAEARGSFAFYAGITFAGLAIRIVMLLLSPRYGYVQDHDDLARWSLQAAEDGVLTLYDHPPKPADLQVWVGDQWGIARREMDRLCNYPPLCAYLLGLSGSAFKVAQPDRLINTPASRWSIGLWGLLFDVLLAWGCARLAARLRDRRAAKTAFALALLVPPFWLVSSLWGQVDTWVLAPLVWTVEAIVGGQWIAAGVWFAIAAGLKPQAAALIPVWGLAVLMVRPFWRPLLSLAVSAVTLFIIALPFTIHSGAAWWTQSYQANLFEHSRGMTTLMAFNIWYLDCLFTGSVDESRAWLGIAKSAWGQIGLAIALFGGLAWMLRRFKRDCRCLVFWSAIVMLAFVMIPTRVHDRFITLVLPFLIVVSIVWRRAWVGLAILLIVATAQVTWPQWLGASAVDWEPFEKEQRVKYDQSLAALPLDQRSQQPSFADLIRPLREDFDSRNQPRRPFEWLFAVLGVAGTIITAFELLRLRPLPNSAPPE